MSAPDMRKAAPERGLAWIKEGSDLLFRLRRSMWVPALALLVVTFLSSIPVLGLLAALLSPLIIASILIGLDRVDEDDPRSELPADAVFSVFNKPGVAARIIGLIFLVGIAFVVVLMAAFSSLGIDLQQLDMTPGSAQPLDWDVGLAGWLQFLLILVAGSTPLLMLAYFAMPRIALDDAGLVDAMISSFKACLKNWLSLCIYFLVLLFVLLAFAIVIGVLAAVISIALPPGLAMSVVNLVLLPLQILLNLILVCAQYIMYRDIFPADIKEASGLRDPMQTDEGVESISDVDEDQFRA